jgi:cytochrome c biogenesis protein CcmG/thiol:disulfide interchange protein DsbE
MLACLFVLIQLSCGDSNGSGSEEIRVGGHVPSFSLKSLDGTTVTNGSLQGTAVVLNFWATWCQPCMGEIPELKELAASSGAKVVGIALDQDGVRTIRPFVASNNINYTVLVGDEEVFQRFNGFGIPYTLVLDRSQRIVHIYRGPVTKESVEQDLKKIEQGV